MAVIIQVIDGQTGYKGPESHFLQTPVTTPALNLWLQVMNFQTYTTLH